MRTLTIDNNIFIPKYGQSALKTDTVSCGKTSLSAELSNYKINAAFIGLNNISFKNLNQPVDITSKYNVNEGKAGHLDVPDIHLYEYPDTKLCAFINETPNVKDNNTYVCLAVSYAGDVKPSPVKDAICRLIVNNNLGKYDHIHLTKNSQGLFTIFSNVEDENYEILENINRCISNTEISVEELEKAKKTLINEISNKQSDKTDIFAIIDKNNLKSDKELIKEIETLNAKEISDYYKNILNSSCATCYITASKAALSTGNRRNKLFKTLNSGIDVKFQTNNNRPASMVSILNPNEILYIQNDKINRMEIHYPYEGKTYKDYFIANCANLLLIFLLQPYINEKSNLESAHVPLNVQDDRLSYKYHKIIFELPKHDYTKLTPERMVNIQKEVTKMLYDTDFTVTLNDIKELYKEMLQENLLKEYNVETNITLYNLGFDVFNIYELIDSVSQNDILNYMDKYILKQNPVVIISNNETSESKE